MILDPLCTLMDKATTAEWIQTHALDAFTIKESHFIHQLKRMMDQNLNALLINQQNKVMYSFHMTPYQIQLDIQKVDDNGFDIRFENTALRISKYQDGWIFVVALGNRQILDLFLCDGLDGLGELAKNYLYNGFICDILRLNKLTLHEN